MIIVTASLGNVALLTGSSSSDSCLPSISKSDPNNSSLITSVEFCFLYPYIMLRIYDKKYHFQFLDCDGRV